MLASQGPHCLISGNGRNAENPVVEVAWLAIPVFLAFAKWRWGLLLCVVTAILQDPIRKITPDQPLFFVVFVGIVFAAACLGAAEPAGLEALDGLELRRSREATQAVEEDYRSCAEPSPGPAFASVPGTGVGTSPVRRQ